MQPGDLIADRFQIEQLAASGGMGHVYRALDLHTDGLAAIKIMAALDGQAIERFTREALLLAELRHPGIVTYLAHGRTAGGELYLAMEWLEGEDLATRLAGRELTLGETVAMTTQLAAALAVAHARGVVHRDVKPSNLFLVGWQPDQVKLLDFGVARLLRLAPLTATGLAVGTPFYMAPEQARGARALDARADVFALGCVLYRCLTGSMPFAARSAAELFALLSAPDEAARAIERNPAIPPPLDELCARMLRKDPAARPPDAGGVLAELLGFGATGVATSSPGRGELTDLEAEPECLVLLGAPLSGADQALALAHGGALEEQGARFAGRLPSDQAQQAARFALASRAPAAAIVAGRDRGRLGERAAALLAREPARLRLDAATAGLLGGRFELAGDDVGLVLLGERGGEAARPLLGRMTELVGRQRELAVLRSILEDTIENGVARAVLITAPPGTGKSRLRLELLAQLPAGVEVWPAFGDPMSAGAPLGLLGQAVRGAAGLDGSEPPAERRARLRERVARRVAPADVQRTAEFLGEIAGVHFDAEGSPALRAARRDVSLLGEQLRSAWVGFLGAETAAAPVLLVLEDLHWADLPTLRLVDDALRALAERPLCVLGLARPEVHDLFPRVWAERGLQEIHLGPLPRKAAERLVVQVLGDRARPEDIAAITDRAGGNAFYLEELIRHVAEGGGRTFPETVLAMAGARFASLGADERRALRAASVFGEVFWAGGVAALTGVAPAASLADLVDRELVARQLTSRVSGEDEYAFRHGLVREAAYALLTDADRALGHRLAGAWLERAGDAEGPHEAPLVLAEHFERGGDREGAARWFQRAAERALQSGDPAAALAAVDRGLACGASGVAEGELLLIRAVARRYDGDTPGAREAATAAMALLAEGEEPWFAAAAEAVSAAGKLVRVDEMEALTRKLLALAAERPLTAGHAGALTRSAVQGMLCDRVPLCDAALAALARIPAELAGEPLVRAWIADGRAHRQQISLDAEEALHGLYEAARLFEEAGDRRNACLARIDAALQLTSLGLCARGVDESRRQAEAAERLGMPIAALLAGTYEVIAVTNAGRGEEALALAQRLVPGVDERRHPRVGLMLILAQAMAQLQVGLDDEAEANLRRAIALVPTGSPVQMPWCQLAYLLARTGRGAEALELAERAMAAIDVATGKSSLEVESRVAYVEALRACGRLDDARREAALARARLLGFAARIQSPELRASFLGGNPANARTLALASELGLDLS